MTGSRFDVSIVIEHFTESLVNDQDNDVGLSHYVSAYSELNKMFPLLGSVFSFVQKDVREKVTLLRDLHIAKPGDYATVREMTKIECEGNRDSPRGNGSRTLLRLHRALEFLNAFVLAVRDSADDVKMASLCRDCYKQTLAAHHPWYVRKSVSFAAFTLGSRCNFIKSICGAEVAVDKTEVNETLTRLLNASQTVYDRVQSIYCDLDILQLD